MSRRWWGCWRGWAASWPGGESGLEFDHQHEVGGHFWRERGEGSVVVDTFQKRSVRFGLGAKDVEVEVHDRCIAQLLPAGCLHFDPNYSRDRLPGVPYHLGERGRQLPSFDE